MAPPTLPYPPLALVWMVEVKDGWKLIESTDTVRLMWDTVLALEFPLLADMAARLFHMHPTSCSVERLWSVLRNVARDNRCRMGVDKTEKLIFIMAQEHLAQKEAAAPPEYLVESIFLGIFFRSARGGDCADSTGGMGGLRPRHTGARPPPRAYRAHR